MRARQAATDVGRQAEAVKKLLGESVDELNRLSAEQHTLAHTELLQKWERMSAVEDTAVTLLENVLAGTEAEDSDESANKTEAKDSDASTKAPKQEPQDAADDADQADAKRRRVA